MSAVRPRYLGPCLAATLAGGALAQSPRAARPPIIDMHLHAVPAGRGRTVDEMLRDMDAHGVVRAILVEGDTTIGARWHARAPGRFLVSAGFPCDGGRDPNGVACFAAHDGWPDTTWLRREYRSGGLAAMGELLNVYAGIAPDDPRLEPYWALAEALDVPVIIHSGRRARTTLPPGCCAHYDDALGNPALLEPVLRRHPRLRISLAHAGMAFLSQTIALMKAHPGVYADISVVDSRPPEQRYAMVMRAYRDAGLLDRIMFGSDNEPYARIIARTDSLSFLTAAERRGIYCENAARFLRLDPGICAKDARLWEIVWNPRPVGGG